MRAPVRWPALGDGRIVIILDIGALVLLSPFGFSPTGEAFNSMADRLVELQEDIRKQERQVMFGRIAAGLVHDLSHPIMNIGNGCKLIVKMWLFPVLSILVVVAIVDSAYGSPYRCAARAAVTPWPRC